MLQYDEACSNWCLVVAHTLLMSEAELHVTSVMHVGGCGYNTGPGAASGVFGQWIGLTNRVSFVRPFTVLHAAHTQD